jgi:ribosomal protein L9
MQVILLERVAKLGHMGESVKVKDGKGKKGKKRGRSL